MQSLSCQNKSIEINLTTTTTTTTNASASEYYFLKETFLNSIGNDSIPRYVHYTYKSHQLPIQYEQIVKHCLAINHNEDVTFLFWTDQSAELFLEKLTKFDQNASNYLSKLKTYNGIEKADVLRLIILYYLGGIYMDLDTECKQPFTIGFDKLAKSNLTRKNITCWLDQEQTVQTRIRWKRKYSAMNNLMICRPRHEFFKYILDRLLEDDNAGFKMEKTGPFMLTKMYEDYMEKWHKLDRNIYNYIELSSPDWFSPDIHSINYLIRLCKSKSNKKDDLKTMACDKEIPLFQQTIQERLKKAILSHQFLNLGYGYAQGKIKKRFDICFNTVNLKIIQIIN